ncbi:hypothetical protein [Nitrosomonas communis]|uniref:Uncharacterized protein n=1 Tax=Nitrosomonas communis TaxID=44574 RepID=A0A1H2W820_9PROT|nr:hypothetical protein [Nitrosomonas communis]SDW76707.1 hypothetical protein SAMN05421882_10279 [Nitrosomonas communis]
MIEAFLFLFCLESYTRYPGRKSKQGIFEEHDAVETSSEQHTKKGENDE